MKVAQRKGTEFSLEDQRKLLQEDSRRMRWVKGQESYKQKTQHKQNYGSAWYTWGRREGWTEGDYMEEV